MMKTLILNGSPKMKGDIATLVGEMINHLEGEVRIISSVFNNISPCIDCRYCWWNSGCAIDDEMQGIYKFLEECDNIVIASPIWFSELSGPLMNLASRMQTYFAAAYFRGEKTAIKQKNGVLILAGAEKGTAKKAASTAHTILKHIHRHCVSLP